MIEHRCDVRPGDHPASDEPDRDRNGEHGRQKRRVDERLDDDGRRESRIRRAGDHALGKGEPRHLAGSGRQHGVQADRAQVCREDRWKANRRVRVRGTQNPLPGPSGGRELDQLKTEPEREGHPTHRAHVPDDRLEHVDHVPQIAHATTEPDRMLLIVIP